jgi:nucleoside-diphosphate-sugar epimerase
MASMKHLLCFGFGFSAQALARRLDRKDWKITGTSRRSAGVNDMAKCDVTGVFFDDLKSIPSDVTHIVSSVPPSPDDPVIIKFGDALRAHAPQLTWAAYLSTTGVYGNHDGSWIDETFPLTPNTERGERRVAAEAQWSALGLPLHIFRLAGIYGPGRNQLLTVRNGTAQRIIKPGQVFSRIHVDDIAGMMLASIRHPHPGRAYNGADDEPAPPQDVVAFAAHLLGLPIPPDIAFADAELTPMARSFYADSKRVSNTRAKNELGYQFTYPTYRDGLRALQELI